MHASGWDRTEKIGRRRSVATRNGDTDPRRRISGTGTRRLHQSAPAALPLLIKVLLALVGVLALLGGVLSINVLMRSTSHTASTQHTHNMVVPGGLLRVDRVVPEHMVPMQHSKFADAGMSMSAMGMDMPPAGSRRFTVEVTLVGQASGGLRYTADDFQISGDGVAATGPLRSLLGNGVVPSGSAMSGTLVFQVPETAQQLYLHFAGAAHPVALELDPATNSHHGAEDH